MLKHSISQSHYGLTTTRTSPTSGQLQQHQQQHQFPLPTTPPPHVTSSSHNSGDSYNQHQQHHLGHHHHHPGHHGQGPMPIDPTRYLEGLPATTTTFPQYHSQNYLDQQTTIQQPQFPSVHNSRLSSTYNLDSIAQGRRSQYPQPQHSHSHSRSRVMKPLSPSALDLSPVPVKPQNGSIYFTSPVPGFGNNNPDITLNTSGHGHPQHHRSQHSHSHAPGSGTLFRQGALRSLSLLSVLSLLLALNALIFLLKIIWPLNMSGGSDSEFKLMYEVTLCLAAMCLSINLCVLLVSSAQYFFAISGSPGTTSFLQRVLLIRGIGITGFFLSIPLYLAAIVLYTFTHLSFAVPALVTTAIVGLAIIFGGCAMVYHVFTWQKEKLSSVKRILVSDVSPNPTIELSTLV